MCVLDESHTDRAECRKVPNGRRIAVQSDSLVNAKSLQFECTRVVHEGMLVPVLVYSMKQ